MHTAHSAEILFPFHPEAAPEAALRSVALASGRLVSLLQHTPRDPAHSFHRVVAVVHDLCGALVYAETAGCTREELRGATRAARDLHGVSPFIRRLQDWPRGYPGDFETIEWLCEATNRAAPGTLARVLETYALASAVAQQHRNKVMFQAECVREAMSRKPDARVLSLACGSSPDIRSILPSVAPAASFVLCDSDPDALAFSARHLEPLGNRCRFVHGSVPRVLRRVVADGPFDLVYAGGLFDYLPDRLLVRTLAIASRSLLAPDGRLVFTNIASGNPFRVWLEYLANWTLIERSESDIQRLCAEAGLDAPSIEREGTALALLVSVRNR
jgi:extracellular factor (EF) 3-hydroxypalmitic acid methyl ester biosynthesis protein